MLYHDFLTNRDKSVYKWLHYLPVYERHFGKFVNQSIILWEIGVAAGGSLQMWKRYFGPFAQIIGIDINPDCLAHCEDQIEIYIGDQSDTVFLQSIIDKHGTPDIIIDDGSHIMDHVCTTFNFVYDKVSKNGVYLVEDMHTAYWSDFGGGLKRERTFIEHCKDLIDALNARHCYEHNLPLTFANSTFSISFYDSIVVFEKTKWPGDILKYIGTP